MAANLITRVWSSIRRSYRSGIEANLASFIVHSLKTHETNDKNLWLSSSHASVEGLHPLLGANLIRPALLMPNVLDAPPEHRKSSHQLHFER